MNASITLDIDLHCKTGDLLPRFDRHFAPLLMRRALTPTYKRRINLFQRFPNLYPDSDTCKESVCAQFELLEDNVTLLDLNDVYLGRPLKVLALLRWEIQFSDAEKGFGLAEENEAFEELAVVVPVIFAIFGEQMEKLLDLPGEAHVGEQSGRDGERRKFGERGASLLL